MFDSILIANRGEIACRIIKTCRRLGVRAVAVYSDADQDALHVAMADDAVRIGPADARSSYLDADAVVNAALAIGAEAIHPGYGFLAEKTVLPDLCARHGLGWIGPSSRCIAQMGSKVEAKTIADRAGVECVPGYHDADQSPDLLEQEAGRIGFPILIKASAGGGGKGMRRVDAAQDFAAALALAKHEALAAFGDDQVLIEKYLIRPRHLEVQVVGDRHGGLIHLFERECSIQRNYQKLIEEAPASKLAPEIRERLLDSAVKLAGAVGYDSLGTVEFVLDADDPRGSEAQPYFLEMNTRLQVEHTVTEAVTGLDLVELQIRIAAGEPLGLEQHDVRISGHAIEARLNAETPGLQPRPCLGRVTVYREPRAPASAVRIDSGIAVGSQITPHYDSLLAKVIGSGPDRTTAARRLARALSEFAILGVGANQAFLRDLIAHPAFHDEVLTTRFLTEHFPDGWSAACPDTWWSAAAAGLFLHDRLARAAARDNGAWTRLTGFHPLARAGGRPPSLLDVICVGDDGTESTPCETSATPSTIGADVFCIGVGNQSFQVGRPEPSGVFMINDLARRRSVQGWVDVSNDRVELFCDGRRAVFKVAPMVEALVSRDRAARTDIQGDSQIKAPMPGMISEVRVSAGQVVARGEIVIVMEAMKLVLSIEAPRDGAIDEVLCAPGATVTGGSVLIRLVQAPVAAEQQV